ncbi:hypothetical protein PIB30_073348 [Stylosanthes scabra]|uniref:Uncharacterized protein n=1 Tax=Stylosanthes scabra TaxID=79078 RepID=A0ABU6XPM8_9FABA|nr:hypothetical protein [Stylosanthes scabra]
MVQSTLEEIAAADRDVMYRLDNIVHVVKDINRLYLAKLVPCIQLYLCFMSSPNKELRKFEVGGLDQCSDREILCTLQNRVNALRNVRDNMSI